MTFQGAKAKLKEIADGKYHSIKFSLTESGHGRVSTKCEPYIDDMPFFSGPTWDDAFRELDRGMNGNPVEAMPEDERTTILADDYRVGVAREGAGV